MKAANIFEFGTARKVQPVRFLNQGTSMCSPGYRPAGSAITTSTPLTLTGWRSRDRCSLRILGRYPSGREQLS